ncbi:TrbG/VirB9 family P-type conjugative transfer protein [Grimontia sp. SpTr1]|uniref:TrbG/VirB9 family P-type conjugative transfer protein n=1 Tax=Grimontia sp. SpTr1 TaxID=2995319 RepID=UPI00248B149C|nr:TrbG/VirB9 family P-type conjugative transfer protein [Grimontia sp. SpTr1]
MNMNTILCVSLFLFSVSAHCLTIPKSLGKDSRVVGVKYDPNDVIKVRTKVGIATLIQLEEGEAVSGEPTGLGMGDAEAWGFDVRGNNIFFKPLAAKPDTNLTVVTNLGRTYAFQLVSSKYPYYIVRVNYPRKPKTIPRGRKVPCSDGKRNFRYGMWGDFDIAPQYAWDDGRFTCFKFSNTEELPVVYQKNGDGEESLVNYHFEQDTMVIHSVSGEFRVRAGDNVLGVISTFAEYSGYNEKASTVESGRVLIGE